MTTTVANSTSSLAEDMFAATMLPIADSATASAKLGMDTVPLYELVKVAIRHRAKQPKSIIPVPWATKAAKGPAKMVVA